MRIIAHVPVPPSLVDREGGAPASAEHYAYPLNKKYQVWSANVDSLYEEAVSRQWSATKDIPWTELDPVSLIEPTVLPPL